MGLSCDGNGHGFPVQFEIAGLIIWAGFVHGSTEFRSTQVD